MIEVKPFKQLKLSQVRAQWLTDLPIMDIKDEDLRRMINEGIRYLYRRNLLPVYRHYRFVFSKNDKHVTNNKTLKICVDFGKIKMKRQTTHTYHVFLVEDLRVF